MNNPYTITPENLLSVFPSALQSDPSVVALAETAASALAERASEIAQLIIFSRIDELPEELLDILAQDFKVDWWDHDYSLEEKRQTLKDSWSVHRTMGTKTAIVKAISAIYQDTKAQEWWEYGGKPYHFKLLINSTFEHIDPQKYQRVLERVAFYKPLRCVLDEVEYYDGGLEVPMYAATGCAGCEIVDGAVAVQY